MQDSIASAAQEDISLLVSLINSAYRGDAARKGWTHEAELIAGDIRVDNEYLQSLMADNNAAILKYTDASNVIQGCVYLQVQGDDVYLGMLSVSPQVQAKGIGKRLLTAGEDWTKAHNKKRIVMNVITVREELIAWYNRNGYADSGVRKPFPDETRFGVPRQRVEFMVMEKKLLQ